MMLDTIRKTFEPTATPIEQPLPLLRSLEGAKAVLKGVQLLRGRTAKTRETRTVELVEAEDQYRNAQAVVGEAVDSGVDLAQATQSLAEAETRLGQLKAALSVAERKDANALAELRQAEKAVGEEEAAATVAILRDVCLSVDDWFSQGKQLIDEQLAPSLNRARQHFSGPDGSFLNDLQQGFECHLSMACSTLIPRGRALEPMLGHRKYSDLCPTAIAKRRT